MLGAMDEIQWAEIEEHLAGRSFRGTINEIQSALETMTDPFERSGLLALMAACYLPLASKYEFRKNDRRTGRKYLADSEATYIRAVHACRSNLSAWLDAAFFYLREG